MKKAVCGVLAVLLFVAMSGCGPSGTVSQGDGDGKYTVQAVGSDYAKDIQLPDLKNKEITVMYNVDADHFKEADLPDAPNSIYHVLQTWKETYGVEVKIETVEWDSFTSYLSTAAAAGTTPDVIPGGPLWYPRWPANNLTMPLDEYLDVSEDIYDKSIMDQLKWNGKYHVVFGGIPEKFYVAYNITKFTAAGEPNPLELWKQGKWNWTQFVKTCKAMTDVNNNEYGFSGWNLNPGNSPYRMVLMNSENKLQLNIDDQKFMRWMTEVYNLYQKEKAARCDWDSANFLTTFPSGKDAMIICTPEEYIRVKQRVEVTGGDEFGIAPQPIFDPTGETERLVTANVYGLSISSKAKNPEGAAAFIRLNYLMSKKINEKVGEFGLLEKYITDEEREMLVECKKDKVVFDLLNGIGKCKSILQENVSFKMYNEYTTQSVKSLFDQAKPLLQAEIDEFYKALGQ